MWATLWLALLLLALIAALFVWLKFPLRGEKANRSTGVYEPWEKRNPYALMAAGALALTFVISAAFACTVIVGTRQTGIVTQWNRPTGETLNNGLHLKMPWTDVHEMDTAIQNDIFNGDKRISVRLGNNSTALADANVRWQIVPDKADDLYVQYKGFDGVRTNLVERNLRDALNQALAKFDPLSADPDKNQLTPAVVEALRLLREKSGDQVEILDLTVPIMDYDDGTETKLAEINQARAETTKSAEQELTAQNRADAAKILANQPVPDLKISIAACVNKMAETGQNLNCFPIGTNVVPTLAVPNPAG